MLVLLFASFICSNAQAVDTSCISSGGARLLQARFETTASNATAAVLPASADEVLVSAEIRDADFQQKASRLEQLSGLLVACLVAIVALIFTGSGIGRSEQLSRAIDKAAAGVSEFRPDVQGLRAFAVMSVFIYHMNAQWLPGGFTGVDIFFVISGYVVTPQLLRKDESRAQWLILFFSRRVKRLVPILIVVILATSVFLVSFVQDQSEYVTGYLRHAIAGLFAAANNLSIIEASDYWIESDDHNNPFVHLWSLGVEEQFYLLWPLIISLVFFTRQVLESNLLGKDMSATTREGALHEPQQSEAKHPEEQQSSMDTAECQILATLLSAIVGSMALCWHFGRSEDTAPTFGFYLVFSRFWELGAGAALVLCSRRIGAILAGRLVCERILDSAAVILLTLGIWTVPEDSSQFPWPCALVPVAGTLCYLAAGLGSKRTHLNTLLSYSCPVYVGNLSYSIYLWHVPVLVLMSWVSSSQAKSAIDLCIAFLLVMLLSVTGYHLIEQPFRQKACLPGCRMLSLAVLSLSSAALFIGILDSWRVLKVTSSQASYPDNLPGLYARSSCSCKAVQRRPFHVPPGSVEDAVENMPQCFYAATHPIRVDTGDDCSFMHGSGAYFYSERMPLRDQLKCLAPQGVKSPRQRAVFLLGDSHSIKLRAGLRAATSRPIIGLHWYVGRMNATEQAVRMAVRSGDLVVYARVFDANSRKAAEYIESVNILYNIVKEAGAKLLLIQDNANVGGDPGKCALHRKSECAVKEIVARQRQHPFREAVSDMVGKHSDIVFTFDAFPLFCDGEVCDYKIPGTLTPAYQDSHHLTSAATLYLSPFICSFLRQHGLA